MLSEHILKGGFGVFCGDLKKRIFSLVSLADFLQNLRIHVFKVLEYEVTIRRLQ
jgi:hypothetical protein